LITIGDDMRLVTYDAGPGPRLGVRDDEHRIRDVTAALPAGADMLSLIEDWSTAHSAFGALEGPVHDVAAVGLLAPIPVPRRNVFCVGKNYVDHSAEFAGSGYDARSSGSDLPQRPIIFTKASTAVAGPEGVIESHAGLTNELDYEAELAVVISKPGRGIPREQAYEHIFGYTVCNDVTARDLQRDHKQWFLGKSLDTFCPLGPALVTTEEISPEEVPALELGCRVNGELRQKARLADLIFDIPTLIATISAGITLQPGDIIATGTPAGVGIGFTPPRFLAPGDVVEIAISRLGTLRNTVH
jgi:2-keto-4-pentenoate hydratase/2-oxohepta-3-ene-1,7-dioic acid hydratase in catechol pathway